MGIKPHQLSVEQLLDQYHSNSDIGLSAQEAAIRLDKEGPNTLPEKKPQSWIIVFLRQFQSPLIYILLCAAGIIYFVGPDRLDAFIISGVLFFNAIIGTIQEGRTRIILHSLKQFRHDTSVVIRDGKKLVIEDKDLVVGDIILLQEGRSIPADARVMESSNVRIDQAILTGESAPMYKTVKVISEDVPVADQDNMVFRGTYVLGGLGKALIVATGADTQIGKINQMVEDVEIVAPLQKEFNRLSYFILFFILALCILLFFIGLVSGKPVKELLVMLTALFICVVPEGLPVVLSLVLASGVYRMAKHNVLAKHMQGVEALGRTNVIVIDKTGTLTRNEMMVLYVCADERLWDVSGSGYQQQGVVSSQGASWDTISDTDSLSLLGTAVCLLNTAEIAQRPQKNQVEIKGDPTEAALYILSKKLGKSRQQLEKEYVKVYEIPFDPQYRYHAAFYKKDDQLYAFVTGAPEVILSRSAWAPSSAHDCLTELLDQGLRMVAVAMKQIDLRQWSERYQASDYQQLILHDLTVLGVCGLQDAIRSDVADIIAQARGAGLSIIMATGDHKKTALFVATKTGIFKQGDLVLEGAQLDTLSDQELLAMIDRVSVFARVSPQHKMRVIDLFHKKGVLVAMTGDGVNDAPSLVAADLGIAMGVIGTEVAKEAADLILLDDSLGSIVRAIELGRHIFYTLKKVILYFFSTNMAEVLIVMFALLAGLPLPITAAQILWLNLITDGFLDIALSTEPLEPGLLEKHWIVQRARLVDKNLVIKMMFAALPMAIGSLIVFIRYYQVDLVLARTLTLLTMAFFQWFNAWNCRSETRSIFQLGLLTNKWLVVATAFVLFLQLLLIYVPFMQHIFKTVSLTTDHWLLVLGVSSSILIIEETRKYFVRRLFRV